MSAATVKPTAAEASAITPAMSALSAIGFSFTR